MRPLLFFESVAKILSFCETTKQKPLFFAYFKTQSAFLSASHFHFPPKGVLNRTTERTLSPRKRDHLALPKGSFWKSEMPILKTLQVKAAVCADNY